MTDVAGVASIQELYDRHAPFVYGLALSMLADASAAEELTQDVFLQCWQRWDQYDPARGSIRTFLATVTRSRAIDRLRRRGRRVPEVAWEECADSGSDVEALENTVDHRLTMQRVHAALGVLPAPQRQALVMCYFGGMSAREIAQYLGHPLGTVKTRIRLGLMRLREELDLHGERG